MDRLIIIRFILTPFFHIRNSIRLKFQKFGVVTSYRFGSGYTILRGPEPNLFLHPTPEPTRRILPGTQARVGSGAGYPSGLQDTRRRVIPLIGAYDEIDRFCPINLFSPHMTVHHNRALFFIQECSVSPAQYVLRLIFIVSRQVRGDT